MPIVCYNEWSFNNEMRHNLYNKTCMTAQEQVVFVYTKYQ